MKPEQFIREYGVEKAREVVEDAPDGATYYVNEKSKIVVGLHGFYADGFCVGIHNPHTHIKISDLKRLVDSVDLVESWGGISDLKLYDLSHCKDKPESAGYKLLQAIADYESIYGGGDE
ncbi:hypothetical protein [Acinetobacter baumannii]|uniref:hypothetical protein n=1 Tax=Acinetobacter baumannii TaxID=470 RepID=UPI0038913BD8